MVTTFVEFDDDESGCLVSGVEDADGRRWAVKRAVNDRGRASLARGLAVHDAVQHAALVGPVEVGDGFTVSPWIDGEKLRHSPLVGRLSVDALLDAVQAVIEVHALVADAGFVSIDLYDGNFLYDVDRGHIHVIDVDEYRPRPFVLDADRTLGSTRFMAPEEHVRGSTLDAPTTVFQLGRTAAVLLGDRSPAWTVPLVDRATQPAPADRYADPAELLAAWQAARP